MRVCGVAKLWAERRAGELLIASRENGQRADRGRPEKTSQDATISTLHDLGVTKHESSRWRMDLSRLAWPLRHGEGRFVAAPRLRVVLAEL